MVQIKQYFATLLTGRNLERFLSLRHRELVGDVRPEPVIPGIAVYFRVAAEVAVPLRQSVLKVINQ